MISNDSSQSNEEKFNMIWLAGALIALIPVGVAIYFLFAWQPENSEQPAEQVVEAPPQVQPLESPAEVVAPEPAEPESIQVEQVPEPEAPLPLPELNESDAEVIGQLSALDPQNEILAWLDTDEIVRKLTVVADNMVDGKVARKYLTIPKPKLPFKTVKKEDKEYIAPQSYARYDSYADTFDSIDLDSAVSFYHRYQPLFEKAYDELGYPDRQFKKSVITAIDEVLATPVILKDIEVSRKTVIYKYVDPELEQLSPLQKQLLRMGPRNIAVIQKKLRRLKTRLQSEMN